MDSIERASGHPGNAMQSLDGMDDDMESIELPSDPDAQATITDFLDFTEYLPSDMNRSLTLIGNLDYKYIKADSKLGELSKMYGELPSLDCRRRPEPLQLRADISHKLNQAVHTRTLAQAEARRMSANVDRHYQKLMYIQEKLEGLFDAFPTAQEELAASTLSVSPQATRTPKITLRLGEYGAHKGTRVKRGPRITVPGEVLAPNEFDWDTYDSECDISDTHDDEPTTPRPIQRRASSSGPKRIKLKVQRPKVDKTPKTPRAPRPAGVMGTNVHSQVAGISTSNALAKLKPPPDGAPVGSEHRPWGRLTPFELAKLRKRMKKNAVWQPSTTMINRELTLLGRSISHFRAAKAEAEAAGQPFDSVWDPYGNAAAPSGGPPAEEAFEENEEDLPIVNKGMKLNEQKKAKKETLAKQAAVEAEESARKITNAARVIGGLFGKAPANGAGKEAAMGTPETAAAKAPPKSAARKRKRESTAEADNLKTLVPPATPAAEPTAATPPTPPPMPTAPAAKKAKTETPVPPPPSSVGSRIAIPQSATRAAMATAEASPAAEGTPAPAGASTTTITTTTSVPLRQPSPRKSSTPILPPTREKRALKPDAKKPPPATVPTPSPAPAPTPATTRARRSATKTPTPAPSPPRAATPAPAPALAPALRRPPSRGHAASAEPSLSVLRERSRRTSTARNTPVPESAARPPSRRAKRPAPGPVTAGEEGSAAISVGRRTAAPRKKAAGRKGVREDSDVTAAAAAQEADIEVDENGVAIDPAEPRYCLCNRVSYGEMIACENNQCQYEWFHLPCVGLTIETLPPRTTKWYCPDCRVALGIGEKGEVSARGRKK